MTTPPDLCECGHSCHGILRTARVCWGRIIDSTGVVDFCSCRECRCPRCKYARGEGKREEGK
jgi:hypothetical protein